MLDLPKSTAYGRRIPKQQFYESQNVKTELRQVFVDQIRQITWRSKIAPTTVNVAQGKTVKEIEVIAIELNQRTLDKRVLPLIDRAIPYHTIFLLEFGGECQAWLGYKRLTDTSTHATQTYYHTDWLNIGSTALRMEGLNMDAIYESLLRQIAGERLGGPEDDIERAVQLDETKQKLTKRIEILENRAMKERQPRRKWELAEEVRRLKEQLGRDQ